MQSSSNKNAGKAMILTDTEGRVLFRSPARPGNCAGIMQGRQLGPAQLLAGCPFVEIIADAG
ncbi:hypothetical protein [Streptomyces sp. SAS_276]|uniref:hypothetical protein n=1 Tax=Streptomyces sp. SAS_276 TaxID=3412745 RepID=UPI00403C996D